MNGSILSTTLPLLLSVSLRAQSIHATPKPDSAKIYNDFGVMLIHKSRLYDAIRYLDKATDYDSTYAPAYNNKGIVYGTWGEYTKAKENYHQALKFRPDYPTVHYNLGVMYQHLKEKEEARKEFEQAKGEMKP